MDENDRAGRRDIGPDVGSGRASDIGSETGRPEPGQPGASWPGAAPGTGPRAGSRPAADHPAADHPAADPGRVGHFGVGRDPHGLEPDRALPSWRARRGGLDPDLARMGKVAGGLALALLAVAGGWSMLGRRPREIPVIEAPAGPLRVRPENAGGMQLANGVDTAPEGTGTLAPPPEVPLPGVLRAQIQAGAAGLAAGSAAPSAQADQAAQGQAAESQAIQGRGDAPAASSPGGPLPGRASAPPAVTAAQHGAPAVRAAASSAPAESAAAPGDVAARPPASSAASNPAGVAARPDAASAPEARGGTMVQLAALESEQGAATEWQRLLHRMPELLGARRPEVQRAEHDGHPVWRLRTGGFATSAQAAEFCVQVRAKGTGCSVAAF